MRATDNTIAATRERALSIETHPGASESTISASGRVVIETSPQLRSTLLESIRRRVSPVIVIDVAGVTHLDTSGIATLLEASQRARARAVQLRVVGLTGEPKVLADVTELARIFAAHGSVVEVA